MKAILKYSLKYMNNCYTSISFQASTSKCSHWLMTSVVANRHITYIYLQVFCLVSTKFTLSAPYLCFFVKMFSSDVRLERWNSVKYTKICNIPSLSSALNEGRCLFPNRGEPSNGYCLAYMLFDLPAFDYIIFKCVNQAPKLWIILTFSTSLSQ